MCLANIIGQDRAINLLKKQLLSCKIPHAYLFVGPEGVGKKKTAIELAKILNCTNQPPSSNFQLPASSFQLTDACDSCISCKKIDKGIHPDVHLIDFKYQSELLDEPIAIQTQIKIDTIREIQREISLKPAEGIWKVFIIDSAEKLSQEASNCLLKTLEEPPENSLIVLLSTVRYALPQTVISRCQYVQFRGLKDEDILKIISNCGDFSKENLIEIIKLANGSAGRVIEIMADRKVVFEFIELYEKICKSTIDTSTVLEYSDRISKDRSVVERLFSFVLVLLREKLKEKFSITEYLAFVEYVIELRRSMRYNVNLTLLTDLLLLKLSKAALFS